MRCFSFFYGFIQWVRKLRVTSPYDNYLHRAHRVNTLRGDFSKKKKQHTCFLTAAKTWSVLPLANICFHGILMKKITAPAGCGGGAARRKEELTWQTWNRYRCASENGEMSPNSHVNWEDDHLVISSHCQIHGCFCPVAIVGQ